ncbi:MAG TPA: hypothetical protein VMG81_05375 [Thermoplasmata archaeon]|nr:hypothetical protein [Thermoplasmata archaeon]
MASPRVKLLPPIKIFVSLVHKQRLLELVGKLQTRLGPWGVDLVLAIETPRPGFDVDAKSRELIDGTDGVLFLCSQSAKDSRRVIEEYVYAGQKGKPRCLVRFPWVGSRFFPVPSGFDESGEWIPLTGATLNFFGWQINDIEFERMVQLIYRFAADRR